MRTYIRIIAITLDYPYLDRVEWMSDDDSKEIRYGAGKYLSHYEFHRDLLWRKNLFFPYLLKKLKQTKTSTLMPSPGSIVEFITLLGFP
jgi:hypothetical protein